MKTKWLILKLFRLADGYYYCIARRRMMLHVSGAYIRGAYIRKEKHFGLQSVNFITFLFLSRFCNNQQPQIVKIQNVCLIKK